MHLFSLSHQIEMSLTLCVDLKWIEILFKQNDVDETKVNHCICAPRQQASSFAMQIKLNRTNEYKNSSPICTAVLNICNYLAVFNCRFLNCLTDVVQTHFSKYLIEI